MWLRRAEAVVTVVPFAMLALIPGTWHRDHVVVANLRRQRVEPTSKAQSALRLAALFVLTVGVGVGLLLLMPWLFSPMLSVVLPFGMVMLAIALWMKNTRDAIWKAKDDPTHIVEAQTVPAADWVGTGFARRPGSDVPGADIIFGLAEELAGPDGTLGLVARHGDLVPVYAAHGLEPVESGSWRMVGRPRVQREPLDDAVSSARSVDSARIRHDGHVAS